LLKKAFPWIQSRDEPPEPGKEVARGKKVVLREKRIEDTPDDYTWRTDNELARLDATRPLSMSYDEYLRYVRDEFRYTNTSSKRLAIDTLDGRHIGNCMYYDLDLRRRQAEIGIMLGDRDYWSKGYGTNSVETLVAYLFRSTPLDRIYLHTLEWNHRARRSFAKAGLRELKSVHRSGQDFILMEILRPEWDEIRLKAQRTGDCTCEGAESVNTEVNE